MTTYFVAAGGSNTAPYDTWAKAATSLQTALSAASTAGDRIIIQYNGVPSTDAELAADTNYTAAADVTVISASNDGGTAFTPTSMGSENWIGNSSAWRSITLFGGCVFSWVGVTFRISGGTVDHFVAATADNQVAVFKECFFWFSNTATTSRIRLGPSGAAGINSAWVCEDCTFHFGSTGQGIEVGGNGEMTNCVISSSGASPTELFKNPSLEHGGSYRIYGCDLTPVSASLVGAFTAGSRIFTFYGCKLGAGVAPLGVQAVSNQSAVEVELLDCSAGDEHYHHAYYNAMGSMVVDTGIYENDGAKYDGVSGCSWKVISSAYASRANPFVTPWISKHHAGTAAITPRVEVLRNGSATAFADDEVWVEVLAKTTAGASLSSKYSDRVAIGGIGTPQPAGIGVAGWTGVGGTAWSGKLEPPSAITPAEPGDVAARVCVGEPSVTVYVDPTIRGA